MYKIDKQQAGYVLTFSGKIGAEEMQRWHDESKFSIESNTSNSFGVVIVMKDLEPLDPETSEIMKKGQKLYKEAGMKRSAVILNSQKVCDQFKLIAIQTGIYKTERYIDASENPDFKEKAINWVSKGIDPDL